MRVQLGAMPAMLGDIVRQVLDDEPSIEVVGSAEAGDDLLKATRVGRADLLIVRENDPAIAPVLDAAGIGILALSSDGREAAFVAFGQHRLRLEQGVCATIARLLRDVPTAA